MTSPVRCGRQSRPNCPHDLPDVLTPDLPIAPGLFKVELPNKLGAGLLTKKERCGAVEKIASAFLRRRKFGRKIGFLLAKLLSSGRQSFSALSKPLFDLHNHCFEFSVLTVGATHIFSYTLQLAVQYSELPVKLPQTPGGLCTCGTPCLLGAEDVEVRLQTLHEVQTEKRLDGFTQGKRLRLLFGQSLDLLAIKEEELCHARWDKRSHEVRPERRVNVVERLAVPKNPNAFLDASSAARLPSTLNEIAIFLP